MVVLLDEQGTDHIGMSCLPLGAVDMFARLYFMGEALPHHLCKYMYHISVTKTNLVVRVKGIITFSIFNLLGSY